MFGLSAIGRLIEPNTALACYVNTWFKGPAAAQKFML